MPTDFSKLSDAELDAAISQAQAQGITEDTPATEPQTKAYSVEDVLQGLTDDEIAALAAYYAQRGR